MKTLPSKLLHGGDYNPEQWPREVWPEDIRLMKKAGINVVSLGIFAWSDLEREEGRYTFEWMDEVVGLLKGADISIMLATPSGGKPPWMARKYPETLRVSEDGQRYLFGERHNHCLTSPVYRQKVAEINRQLARRYGADDSVILWHISNEYNGECRCPLCQDAFRGWLQQRYGTLDALNAAWWGSFWSHRYSDWGEINAPVSTLRGENMVHGHIIAWKRFITDQTISFFRDEVAALREIDKETPVTTNFMGFFPGIDYGAFARELDILSWDSYPEWHFDAETEVDQARYQALVHDFCRSAKGGRPFLLMESTPSTANYRPVNKPKKPGMNQLASLHAIAHGSASVQYFQWRKSRGSAEKFHGAVVDHCGHEDTRVFREVAELGRILAQLPDVAQATTRSEIAMIFDWNNRWAIESSLGFRNDRKDYSVEVMQYYHPLWQLSLAVDCHDESGPLDRYKLVVAPMLYMLKPGVAEKLEAFVAGGGTLVVTAQSGTADQDDLIFPGGQPGPLRKLLGLWVEEADVLYDREKVPVVPAPDSGLSGDYSAREICERLRLDTAVTLARYGAEFYSGEPCLTANSFGQGRAYYIGFRANDTFVRDFIAHVTLGLGLHNPLREGLPAGVDVRLRSSAERDYLFLLNFTSSPHTFPTPQGGWENAIEKCALPPSLAMPAFGSMVLQRARGGE